MVQWLLPFLVFCLLDKVCNVVFNCFHVVDLLFVWFLVSYLVNYQLVFALAEVHILTTVIVL